MEYAALFSIFIIGLSYGATACMFSCMPFLTPLLVSNSSGTKQAMGIILPFSLGRIFSYTLIAVVAYLSSAWVKQLLNDNSLFGFILGFSTIGMGTFLLYKSFKPPSSCGHTTPLIKKPKLNKFGFFAIGATMSVNPCAPIMALLAVAANSSNIYNTIGLGLFFGLGAVLFSILFYGFIVSKVIKGFMIQFSSYRLLIERAAALLLMIVGVLVLNGVLIL
ncbi:sulfite exporter TauE/SafE family protein [Sulfurimonas sp. CVO]|jgi:cytochrome c biogenesis protein CcdA|uniref:sulfite exporter TauE/SafE family protein n=1 Tax=Sulfurimonas sp. CVO TaxID=2283483 RepID=UPI00132EC616|nr:sulfite exporter TauE/SafE family protein [Sulfurimonas sp. CVO]QHG90623.1 sulfite exporter TauE/SafE family protein [Sulfurimonas sp. CVO]